MGILEGLNSVFRLISGKLVAVEAKLPRLKRANNQMRSVQMVDRKNIADMQAHVYLMRHQDEVIR
ncbi:MAG: hypothetical protein ACE3JK_08105 [Sporolactobacillus sp.]